MKNYNLFIQNRLIFINNHEKRDAGSETPVAAEPTLRDAQTEEGRERILAVAKVKLEELNREADLGDDASRERAERIEDIIKKYTMEGLDPIHYYDPNTKGKALGEHAKNLFNTLTTIKKEQAVDKKEEQDNKQDAPEWLRTAVFEAPLKEFKGALDEALTRLNEKRENPYTRLIIDRAPTGMSRNPNLLDLLTRLAELDGQVRGAKSIAEIERATREVLRISNPNLVDDAMKSDWAFALVSDAVNSVFEGKNNMNPKELLRLINTEIAKLSQKEPLKSQPNNAVYRMHYRGIDLSVAKMAGNSYVASIDGIDEFYEHMHPKIASYVHDRDKKESRRV